MEDNKEGKKIRIYSFARDAFVLPQRVSYGDEQYHNFNVREIFIDDVQNGEYHVQVKENSIQNINFICAFFIEKLVTKDSGNEVGLIDVENRLNLEHQIYIKINDQLMLSVMPTFFDDIDVSLTKSM